jgi:hypothetical protein
VINDAPRPFHSEDLRETIQNALDSSVTSCLTAPKTFRQSLEGSQGKMGRQAYAEEHHAFGDRSELQ